ncbi:MAG: shikimate dehydrogenase [Myxococcales bacterium]|nr:MAG: shikimate dehydrogenase [Myxococcales bacterium]
MTDFYGIFGYPVGHSKSPAMHNAAFRKLGMDALYLPYSVPSERLAEAFDALRMLGMRGVNLTVPHKEAALPLLDELSEAARQIGAVNTIINDNGVLKGCNTDAPGLIRALQEDQVALSDARVIVIGAGGAARAAVFGLMNAGCSSITIAARRKAQADALVRDFNETASSVDLSSIELEEEQLIKCFRTATLLIQATSATLKSDQTAQAFVQSLPLASLPKDAVALDLIYSANKSTLFCIAAEQSGLRSLDGTGMLLHQGALAFELWTTFHPPLESMRVALTKTRV